MRQLTAGALALALALTGRAATFTVVNVNDSGPGSLRQALLDGMASAEPREIQFLLAPTGGVTHTITLLSPLPALTNRLTLDAATQPGYSNRPLVRLVPTGPAATVGLNLQGGSNVVRGLHLTGFSNSAVSISARGGSAVTACELLTNRVGVAISGAGGHVIGGETPGAGNVIGRGETGIQVNGPGADGNLIAGNFIGVAPFISAGIPVTNQFYGLALFGSSSNRVRGSLSALQVISGNGQGGIFLAFDARHNRIEGNFVGLNTIGSGALPNQYGIIVGAPENLIGGDDTSNRNVVAGNTIGVYLSGSACWGNRVAGNFIGTTAGGTVAVPASGGVRLDSGASNNVIQGTAAAPQLISGCVGTGVFVIDAGTEHNVIIGNTVGLDVFGNVLSNQTGIALFGVKHTQVGGPGAGEGNVLAGNSLAGLWLTGGAQSNTVLGNRIGLNAAGAARPNGGRGIWINEAHDNRIGGTDPGSRNVISGNTGPGLEFEQGSSNNVVLGNFIGPRPNGASGAGNVSNGISVLGYAYNRIGGTNAGEGNVIAYNAGRGLATVSNSFAASRTTILGNLIHDNGISSIDLDSDGFTGNDAAPDADSGSNGRQNYPQVTNAVQGSTLVQGTFVSAPSQPYLLEFFAARAGGEAELLLGRTNFALGASGTGAFSFVLGGTSPTGWVVSATATTTNGLTSELNTIGSGGIVKAAVDADGDGMWDSWELANFGTLASNATGNADGDAFNNLQEFLADTSPTNAAAYFRMASLTNGLPHFPGWVSSAGRWYDVDYSTNLFAPAWLNIASNVVGNGGLVSVADGADETNRFYRARAKLP